MDEFMKLLDPALNYVEHIIKENKCIITVESNRKEAICSYCGSISSRKHSVYKKELQDPPSLTICNFIKCNLSYLRVNPFTLTNNQR